MTSLSVFHRPDTVAVVGASDNPDKIGGRPLRYLRDFGFKGRILPVNPARTSVQGIPSYRSLEELPTVPDVALVAVPGQRAVDTVERCAELGVRGVVVLASGFAETSDPVGIALQEQMSTAARGAGMRMIGPNSQGLADFSSGAILGFSTMFIEEPPSDGPVGVISQSGAMCSVPYGLLRRMGVGVRYAHATGNEADVTVGELAGEVLADPDIHLVLLYLEDLRDPGPLEAAARLAAKREVPVVALMGGRSEEGQRAAASHTGALANEDRVVDAFFERIGVWRARSSQELVASTQLYLQPWRPRGRRLAVVSNSGAVCVLAADAAADHGVPLARLAPPTLARLDAALPPFATRTNPVDITAALLTDSSLVGRVLAPLADDPETDACLLAIPVSGRGYDVKRFAADATEFSCMSGKPLVVVTPQPSVANAFAAAGLAVFPEESAAVGALAQYLNHHDQMETSRRRGPFRMPRVRRLRAGPTLNEVSSLDVLEGLGIPVVPHRLCPDPTAAGDAFDELGSIPVVAKGCTADVTHKSEFGLVRLDLRTRSQVEQAADELALLMREQGFDASGILIMPMVRAAYEALVGGHYDPVFGPVVVVGAGGAHVEVLPDVQILLPPFDVADAVAAIRRLRSAPLLDGVRGMPEPDVTAWAKTAVLLAQAMTSSEQALQSVDVNPLMLLAADAGHSGGAVAVDAVVISADSSWSTVLN